MSIFKRLKNLWTMSTYEVTEPHKGYPAGTSIVSLFKSQKAQIVNMSNPIKDLKLD